MRLKLISFLVLCSTLSVLSPCRAALLEQHTIFSQTNDWQHQETRISGMSSSAFSRDGKLFASTRVGHDPATFRIWNTRTGKPFSAFTIPGLQYHWVQAFAWSPDNRTLAVVANVNGYSSVRLHDVRSGVVTRTLVKPGAVRNGFYSVAFSPDGKLIAAGDGVGLIRVWKVKSGPRIAALQQGGFVNSLAFAPNGKTLAAGGTERGAGIKLWAVPSGKLLHSAAHQIGNSEELKFAPNGKQLVTGDEYSSLRLYDASNLSLLRQLFPSRSPVSRLALSLNGKRVAFVINEYIAARETLAMSITVRDTASLKRVITNYAVGEESVTVRGTNEVVALYFAPSGHELFWTVHNHTTDGKGEKQSMTLWHARF